MTEGKAGDRVGGLSKRLLVLFLTMVIAGFAIPSTGVGAPNLGLPASRYHALAKPSLPELLIVPSIGLNAPVLPIQLSSAGVLTPPGDVHDVGFWTGSAKPGAKHGQTVITGHTVHTGGGVMNQLGDLRPGDLIRVRTPRGTVDYRATRVFVYTKAEVFANRQQLFNQNRQHNRLVLITCTGWTGFEYTSNIVVFADPLGVRNTPAQQRAADSAARKKS